MQDEDPTLFTKYKYKITFKLFLYRTDAPIIIGISIRYQYISDKIHSTDISASI